MYMPSHDRITVRTREEEVEEDRKKIKRPRAKLTCLNCKRRKTKCDKCYPCSSCTTRGESDSCHYEEGYELSSHNLSNHEYKAIQDRLERIENALLSSPRPFTSPSTTSRRRMRGEGGAATQERAHSVLVASGSKPNYGPSPTFQEDMNPIYPAVRSDTFPNIIPTTTQARSARWHREMQLVFDTLPNERQMEFITNHYFSKMQFLGLHIVEGVFRNEMTQFLSLKSLNLHFSVDPAWLAQLVCILWVTCHYLTKNEQLLRSEAMINLGLNKSGLINLAIGLYDALEMAFNCSGWLFRPQLRILQTLLVPIYLNMQGCYHTGPLYGPPSDWSCCLWFDIAVGICKGLDLHLDPKIEDIAKLQDPALPPSRPTYSIQMVRRVFHDLLLFDTYSIINSTDVSRKLLPYAFPDESILTPSPSNYTDQAILSEGQPCPRSEKTPFVWTLHQNLISQEWRKIVVLLENLDGIPYSAVMERNQVLRDAFTDFLALKADGELNQHESDAFDLTYSSYQQRFLRLHRPFFLRGYRDTQFDYSRITVMNGARQIAKTHRRLLNDSSDRSIVKSAVFMFQHHITALPILLLNALHDRSSSAQMRIELMESSEAFMRSFNSGFQLHTRIAAKGVCIADEMIKVIDNPPENLQNIEDLLQSINVQSKAAEMKLLQTNMDTNTNTDAINSTNINSYLDTRQPEVDVQAGSNLMTGDQTNMLTLLPNAEQNWWDTDWMLFLRDM
ncbi:hypothetical protein I204_05017 [Kwoniella mangroviensis CBS 8886]|nr:hypothetical protein I204_05017 [Kwoniella mangroviensis CBS 8886]